MATTTANKAFVENSCDPYLGCDDNGFAASGSESEYAYSSEFSPTAAENGLIIEGAPVAFTAQNLYSDQDAVDNDESPDYGFWIHRAAAISDPISEDTTLERPKTPVLPDGQNGPSHTTPKDPSAPGKGKRFKPDQNKILRRFFMNQGANPNAESKRELAAATGLAEKQVTGWFNNERRKSRKANTDPTDLASTRMPHRKRKAEADHATEVRGHSMSGLHTPPSEAGIGLSSLESDSPMLSLPLDQPGRPIQRRSGRPSNIDGRFPCTFCGRSSKTAHEWAKHENTHLSTEIWTCGLCPSQDRKQSGRKDHFVQHLRQVHRTGYDATFMSGWCSKTDNICSRCGFCSLELVTWTERKSHLCSHFREGRTMAEWTGDLGLDYDNYLRLENATPPESWPNRAYIAEANRSDWAQLAL
ncbi:MAG: hypothetical protein M1824_000916 [Vezdaea acicularis]|nr:MAG: hypothetical protein M1824_000916 [Vezdaea acicularis]